MTKEQARRFNQAVEEYALSLVAASWEMYADRLRDKSRRGDQLLAAEHAAGEVASALRRQMERGRTRAVPSDVRLAIQKIMDGDGDSGG